MPLPSEVLDLMADVVEFRRGVEDTAGAERVLRQTVAEDSRAAAYPRVRALMDTLR